MTFLKRQHCADGEQVSGPQGLEAGERESAREVLGAMDCGDYTNLYIH